MQVVRAADYQKALSQKIPRANARIILTAMIITWGEKTGEILSLVEKALKRGVHVTLLCDGYYSRLPIAYGEFWNGPVTRARRPQTEQILRRLQAKGAAVHFTRTTGRNPYKGAYHAKITVIDDEVYSFGGVNFNDEAFALTDYMLYTRNRKLGDMLEELVRKSSDKAALDVTFAVDQKATVLFDAGQPGSSVIYARACELSVDATKVWYVSQMCPSGKLAQLLRRTESYCYFNRPQQSIGPNGAAIAVDQVRYGIGNLYEGNRYIHAKFILFEYADGKKRLLSGSHNFSWRGVRYGTTEIALESHDLTLWRNLYVFIQQEVLLP